MAAMAVSKSGRPAPTTAPVPSPSLAGSPRDKADWRFLPADLAVVIELQGDIVGVDVLGFAGHRHVGNGR